jgi:hypothetical protein
METFPSGPQSSIPQTLTSDNIPDISEYLNLLNNEKLKLADEGRYVEAEQVKRKIQEIKRQIDNTTSKNIESQHEIEMRFLQEECDKELGDFQSWWDNKFSDFGQKSKMEEDVLNENHSNEMKELLQYIEEVLPKIYFLKYSKEYLDLRQIEYNMKKQEMYMEASMIKMQADMMQRNEIEKFNKEKESLIKSKMDKLMRKQSLEKSALNEKNFIEFEIMKKEKEANLDKIIQKYKNKKNDLENQHKTQRLIPTNKNLLKASK